MTRRDPARYDPWMSGDGPTAASDTQQNPPGTYAQRWLARLSFVFAAAAVVIVPVFAGLKSLAALALGLAAVALSLASGYLFLARRGLVRWLSLAVLVLAPIAVLVVYAFARLLLVAIAAAAAWLLAGTTARLALAGRRADRKMPEHPVDRRAARPFLIMNPKSGGGKVGRFGLQREAEDLGAEVFLMSGPEPVDVAEVARTAVAAGADLLGVAGGDGTQALVAGIAARHGLPFVVIPAGTRNHFALDLGLDREDPAASLAALSDGVDLLVDIGEISGRTFVNNASFGAYAEVVQTPAYRGDKVGTTLDVLPDLLQGQRGARLVARASGTQVSAPQAVLVSNNPYGTADIAGLGRRVRLDRGVLGVVAVTVGNALQAMSLLGGRRSDGLALLTTKEVTVTADTPQIPVGVDGEALSMPVPVVCTIRPGALRVRVPRNRPGATPPQPPVTWDRLWHLADPAARHGGYARFARLDDLLACAARLAVKTLIVDVEPLVAPWNSGQEPLDRGLARFLGQVKQIPSVRVVVFSTNSARRPAVVPSGDGIEVRYLASAGKPLRTAPYRDLPRPGAVVGDQLPTDGLLAYRLGYAFLHYAPDHPSAPVGPRLMHRWGQALRPVLFRRPACPPDDHSPGPAIGQQD
jgi:diacylglycerol kinase family enzyme/predicted HAD superfamily phosphohydrolase YqeG